MPVIDIIDGVKVCIYGGEHRPPHFHAIYNEFEVVIEIENGNLYAGELPNRQMKKISDWLAENFEWALQVFYELNPELL